MAGDVARGVGGEEEERADELLEAARAAHRGARAHPFEGALVAEHALGHLGGEPGRREGVHAHPAPRPLRRQLARQVHHPALRRRVAPLRDLPDADDAEDRRHVHDRAAARREHLAPEALRAAEAADEVHLERRPEGLDGLLLGRQRVAQPRVVDEHLDRPEPRRHLAGQALDRLVAGDVAGEGVRLRAGGAQPRGELLEAVRPPGRQRDARPRGGQPLGERDTDPRRGARHDRDAPVEAERPGRIRSHTRHGSSGASRR